MKYEGVVHVFFETGTEGGLLAFQDEQYITTTADGTPQWSYRGLHCLNAGDHLIVFDREKRDVLWSGVLGPILDRAAKGDVFTLEDKAANRLMRQAPSNLPPQWVEWFLKEFPATLEKT